MIKNTRLQKLSMLTLLMFGTLSNAAGYGPLSPAEASNAPGRYLLSLPAGFKYIILTETNEPMSDGLLMPAKPDGQAIFVQRVNGKDKWVSIRNHELGAGTALGPLSLAYDPAAQGSMMRYEIDFSDPSTLHATNASLLASGMVWPCSGGATPRKTWIGCEEATKLGGNAGLQ